MGRFTDGAGTHLDQHALNFVRRKYDDQNGRTAVRCFSSPKITLSLGALPQIVGDYRAYLTGEFGQVVTDFDPTALSKCAHARKLYAQSIEYEMTVLFDFIR